MYFSVAWLLKSETGNKILVASPDSIRSITSVEDAKDEARTCLTEMDSDFASRMSPLAIVEINEHMLMDVEKTEALIIAGKTEEDPDLEFQDVSKTVFWSTQSWWPK